MLNNYLKLALRHLLKNKFVSGLNILGLAIGFGCCLLLFTYILSEFSYDRFHKNSSRIYRTYSTMPQATGGETVFSCYSPFPLAPALKESYADVRYYSRIVPRWQNEKFRIGDAVYEAKACFVDSSFFQMFSFTLLSGEATTVLRHPDNVVISRETAMLFFNEVNPIGEPMLYTDQYNNVHNLVVSGVFENRTNGSSLKLASIILPIEFLQRHDKNLTSAWNQHDTETFIQLQPGISAAEFEGKLPPFVEQNMPGRGTKFKLQPLTDLHFNSITSPDKRNEAFILLGIACLVLVLSCISFVILSNGLFSNRITEIGIKKIIGSNKRQLTGQFIGENLIIISLALGLGCLLADLLLPAFNYLAKSQFTLWQNVNVLYIALTVVGLLAISILAGLYPAVILSSLQPIAILTKQLRLRGTKPADRLLIIAQFVVVILFMSIAVVMFWQTRYVKTKDLGFDGKNILVVEYIQSDQYKLLKEKLAGHSSIVDVTFGMGPNSNSHISVYPRMNDQNEKAELFNIDYSYFDLFEIDLLDGRTFLEDYPSDIYAAVLVNEAFVKKYGLENPLDVTLYFEINPDFAPAIIGVVRDFHIESLHHTLKPVIFALYNRPSNGSVSQSMYIKVRADEATATIALLKSAWKEITGDSPLSWYFLQDRLATLYAEEQRAIAVALVAALFTVIISCLSLLGLVLLSTNGRTKEIGIRKVLGISSWRLNYVLLKDFLVCVIAANLFAWPLAWLVSKKWLEHFAYRIDVTLWPFLLAGALALLIVLFTVSWQSMRAAGANPVEALRYE